MVRPRKERPPTASARLQALLGYPWPFPGRPPKHDLSTWTVADDWPEHIPLTEAEVDVFEACFGDLFDELFGPCQRGEKETYAMTVPLRAALYRRVSTVRQAEHDVSIPDQKRQGEAYCATRGYELVETFIEAGAPATNDRCPEFQRMIEAGTSKPAPFDIVVVHSFSRFFRDHFELAFCVRKLAMQNMASRIRVAICATAIAAFSVTTLMPTPASAWWHHPGWHPGWHRCCWGPRVVVGVVPPVVAVPPPVVVRPPPVVARRVWIPPHWNGPYWFPGHWV